MLLDNKVYTVKEITSKLLRYRKLANKEKVKIEAFGFWIIRKAGSWN